jgi:hypothetical protein
MPRFAPPVAARAGRPKLWRASALADTIERLREAVIEIADAMNQDDPPRPAFTCSKPGLRAVLLPPGRAMLST